mmetsp:Transcript_21172/g.44686  ORF Transcript_21172/g.44686 Transcript_21172/m.44686 type:complete len:259 (-) Transcript_21172:739-1515(-)
MIGEASGVHHAGDIVQGLAHVARQRRNLFGVGRKLHDRMGRRAGIQRVQTGRHLRREALHLTEVLAARVGGESIVLTLIRGVAHAAIDVVIPIAHRSGHVEGKAQIEVIDALFRTGSRRGSGTRRGRIHNGVLGNVNGNSGAEGIVEPTLGTGTRNGSFRDIVDIAVVSALLDAPNDAHAEVQQSVAIRIGAAEGDGFEGVVGEEAGGAEIVAVVGGGVGREGFDLPDGDFAVGSVGETGDVALFAGAGGSTVRCCAF